MRKINDLSKAELRAVVGYVQSVLYRDPETGDLDAEKEWTSDEVEMIAECLDQHGLVPQRKERK